MSHGQQPQRPVTYGDVFPTTQSQEQGLATEPVTMEDAALMQSAENLAVGKTKKGTAASIMQSASSRNVDQGLLEKNAHSELAEYGMTVSHTSIPGAVIEISYVAGNPVLGSAQPTPTDPAIAALDAVTIGEAMEAAAVGAGDKPVDESDARAILSAEACATGVSGPVRGGIGAIAQSAAELNERVPIASNKTTLADVLMDATECLRKDKVVTHEDAEKVVQAELRYKSNSEGLTKSGVGAATTAAADMNERMGLIPPPGMAYDLLQGTGRGGGEAVTNEDDLATEEEVVEVGRFYPVEDSTDETTTASSTGNEGITTELTTPLINPAEGKSEKPDSESLSYYQQLEELQVPSNSSTPPPPNHPHDMSKE